MKIIEFFTVQTEHIVDVRKGQKSSGFDKYPYEEMEQQSLSVFVQEEKQSMYNHYMSSTHLYPIILYFVLL